MDQAFLFIDLLFRIYWFLILIYVFMSWAPGIRQSFIGDLIGKVVEPYLELFRRLIPPLMGMIDFSPILALIALQFIQQGLISVLELFL